MTENKKLALIFTAVGTTGVAIGSIVAMHSGYTAPFVLLVGGGTGLSAVFGGAVGAVGGIALASLWGRRAGDMGFEGFGRAIFAAFAGGAVGAVAAGLLSYNILDKSLKDIGPIEVKEAMVMPANFESRILDITSF